MVKREYEEHRISGHLVRCRTCNAVPHIINGRLAPGLFVSVLNRLTSQGVDGEVKMLRGGGSEMTGVRMMIHREGCVMRPKGVNEA